MFAFVTDKAQESEKNFHYAIIHDRVRGFRGIHQKHKITKLAAR